MQFDAKARFIRCSPYKLRPLIDVIRGKKVSYALHWLATCSVKRATPIKKMLESAVANAKSLQNIDSTNLTIKEIRVDEGPSFRYDKPGEMGRSNIYKKRSSHLKVSLEPIAKKED